MRKKLRLRISLAVWAICALHAQTFDAASVKPAAGGRPEATGGPGSKEPGRVRYANQSLQNLLLMAYDLQGFRLAAPGWMETERFDIDAVLPADTSTQNFRAMLQNLLSTRFRMKLHRETKEMSGYTLVATAGGIKFHESTEDFAAADPAQAPPLQLAKDGFFVPPHRPGVFLQLAGMTGARETFRQSTMQELANSLESQLQRPVTDGTGLTGKYDFTVTFATEGLFLGRGRIAVGPASLESPPDIATALRSQLGLRLESHKTMVEMLVIDHAEKTPTDN